MNRIYLDYAATTPLDPRVADVMQKTQKEFFGNPSSIHAEGQAARTAIDRARRNVAEIFDRREQDMVFTPSATAANNLVLQGVIKRFKKLYPHSVPEVIISPLEHASVYEAARALEKNNEIKLHLLSIGEDGQISINELREKISKNTVLVSVQWVNNETGIIQPLQEIIETVKEYRDKNQTPYPFFHTDAVQGIGNLPISEILGADYLIVSAHKIHGPKGIGVLLLPGEPLLDPILYGGGQENGWWSGTEPTEKIVGCAEAIAYVINEQRKNHETLSEIRAYTIEKLQQCGVRERLVIHSWKSISPHILSVQLCGVTRPDIALDMRGIAVSSGAACSQQSVAPSRVLQALGLSEQEARENVRISFGKQTIKNDIHILAKAIEELCKK